jgi:hypothetical protein
MVKEDQVERDAPIVFRILSRVICTISLTANDSWCTWLNIELRRNILRTLCETRWSSRADSLFTFRTAFSVVVSALETLKNDKDEKAGLYLKCIPHLVIISVIRKSANHYLRLSHGFYQIYFWFLEIISQRYS